MKIQKDKAYVVRYYDRTKGHSEKLERIEFDNLDDLSGFLSYMNRVNQDIFEDMIKTYKMLGITETNYKDCNVWNMLVSKMNFEHLTKYESHLFRYDNNAVGYCFIEIHEVEEPEPFEEMYDDGNNYEEGPYGGAFRDMEDYHNWREGPGFFG